MSVHSQRPQPFFIACLALFSFVPVLVFHPIPSIAATLVLQNGIEGYDGTEDATIYSADVNFSNGANSEVTAGRAGNMAPNPSEGVLRRAAIRFDLSPVPMGVNILRATLEWRLAGSPDSPAPIVDFTLHPILADWNEGIVNGGMSGLPANPGDITWNSRMSGSEDWTMPGGDFGPASATTTVTTTNGYFSWSGPDLTQDVIDWISQPQTNFGWMLVGDESGTLRTARRFNASESSQNLRPRLVIEHDGDPMTVNSWELY